MALSTGCWFQTHINYVTDCLSNKFLYNRCQRERRRRQFCHRIWTYHNILVDDVHREELDKMALEMSGSKQGSATYLGCYKKSIKAINRRLDEDTQVKYRAEAKKWTEQQAPPQQQQRYEHANHCVIWEVTKSYQGCLRSMVSTPCRTFLSLCTYNLTTYYLAMTSIMN